MNRPGASLRVRAISGLLGVAVGDALGATVEFMSPRQIADRYGRHDSIVGGGALGWRPGQGTDDTDLTWAVVSAYLDGYSPTVAADHMLAWLDTGPPDVGGTTRAGLATYAASGDPTTSGRDDDRSAGNGSLMRCLPTAIVRDDEHTRAIEAAEISAITHAEPRAVDSCIAYTDIANALLNGQRPEVAIAAAAARAGLHPEVRAALDVPADTLVEQLDTSGYVISSLRCAVWAVRQPRPAAEVLVDLVNRGDDADTTGAIAGGLLGLRDPAPWPPRWLDALEYRLRLIGAAGALLELRAGDRIGTTR